MNFAILSSASWSAMTLHCFAEPYHLDGPPNGMFCLIADVFSIYCRTATSLLSFKQAVDAVLNADGPTLQIGILLHQRMKQIADFDAKEVFSLLLILTTKSACSSTRIKLFYKIKSRTFLWKRNNCLFYRAVGALGYSRTAFTSRVCLPRLRV
jgi:hypothetical protein